MPALAEPNAGLECNARRAALGSWCRCSSAPLSHTPARIRVARLMHCYPLKLTIFQKMCGSQMEREARRKEHTGDACAELRESELMQDAFVKDDEIVFRRE